MTFENLRREISAAYLADENTLTASLLERASSWRANW